MASSGYARMRMAYGAYEDRDILAAAAIVLVAATFALLALRYNELSKMYTGALNTLKFLYATFLKPHSGDGEATGQQGCAGKLL